VTPTARGPRSLHDAATVLESWEVAARAPAALRGTAVLAAVHPAGDAVLDLPLAEFAVLATDRLAEMSRDEVDGVLDCADCGALLDVRVRLSDLFADPGAGEPVRGTGLLVRPPTPRDLAVAGGEPDARAMLLRRCVTRLDGTAVDPADLGPTELAEIDDALESLAGPALPVLRAACPSCAGTATGIVDVADLLWQQVAVEAGAVLRDVARLAATFGWREPDVLALSPLRRSAYLALASR
jgi:hypothetical protein